MNREGYVSLEDTKKHLSAIEDKKTKLDEERHSLEGRLAETSVGEDQGARLEQAVAKVAARLERLTDVERFEVAHSLIDRVVFG